MGQMLSHLLVCRSPPPQRCHRTQVQTWRPVPRTSNGGLAGLNFACILARDAYLGEYICWFPRGCFIRNDNAYGSMEPPTSSVSKACIPVPPTVRSFIKNVELRITNANPSWPQRFMTFPMTRTIVSLS